ncbi:Methyltransferase-like protein 9 [Desmophyllum pertusum]|uniref:Methyltransferase-like protein 9 n=1 Tax=Desmophyllum pertusum TaxID=174260 RepID=A0A9W9Z422_9CNID|nr:Methyltransferase-like protein 9 [Desmophyllum pertusum]
MWASQYVRSRTGRLLLERLAEEDNNQEIDKTTWYKCTNSALSQELQSKFVESSLDEETEAFLKNCDEKADAVFSQIGHLLFKGFFGYFMSVTTANGILDRGSMFVFSNTQFQRIMGVDESWKTGTLLDLGAGDGKVTSVIKHHFDEVYVTEQSPAMRWRLSGRGFKLLDESEWMNVDFKFDVISCLNLLDRCDKPLTLLSDIRRSLHPVTGRLVVAVVLPFKPCVESGTKMVQPSELITVNGSSWEDRVHSLVEDVFEPSGFAVELFTRVPYLCEGDLYREFYFLNDALFVLKATG